MRLEEAAGGLLLETDAWREVELRNLLIRSSLDYDS